MLATLRPSSLCFSSNFVGSFARGFSDSISKNPPPVPRNKYIENLFKVQKSAWDNTFNVTVEEVVERLEPENKNAIMSAAIPTQEQIEGKDTANFDTEAFQMGMLRMIVCLGSNIQIPDSYLYALHRLTKNHTADEIISAIKTVITIPDDFQSE